MKKLLLLLLGIILVGCTSKSSSQFVDMNNPKQTAQNISQWYFNHKDVVFVRMPRDTSGKERTFYTSEKTEFKQILQVHVTDDKVNYIMILFKRDDVDKLKQFLNKMGIVPTENENKVIGEQLSEALELNNSDCTVLIRYIPNGRSYFVKVHKK